MLAVDLDSVGSYLDRFAGNGALLTTIVVGVILSFTIRFVSRRTRSSTVIIIAALWSLAAVIGFTLRLGGNVGTAPMWWMTNFAQWSEAFTINGNWLLNVGLFIPATMFWSLVIGRPTLVTFAFVAISATIETIQQFTSVGIPDPADFVANSIGAMLGGVAAAVLVKAKNRSKNSI